MNPDSYKKHFAARSAAFRRFNAWEQKHPVEMGAREALAAVGKLYELMPIESRHRVFDPNGVTTMRRALSRLEG
jgi:hypothetical protein